MIDAIYKRRSTRHFIKKQIPADVLTDILTAGTKAPSEKTSSPGASSSCRELSGEMSSAA